jgi:hypothetical protein
MYNGIVTHKQNINNVIKIDLCNLISIINANNPLYIVKSNAILKIFKKSITSQTPLL